jgi:plastocyanin
VTTTTTAPPTTTTAAPGGTTHAVGVGQFFFSPTPVTISVGDTITWTNLDIPHTVTSGSSPSANGIWDSGVLLDGESFSRTFNEAGTFQYFCTIHPTQMIATVVVNP